MDKYYNHRWEVKKAIQTEIAKWKTEDPESSPYPLQVKSILNYWQEPRRLSESDLPAILYGVGSARENDAVAPSVNFKGETCTLIVYAVVNALATHSPQGGWVLEKSVVQRATEMELMIQHLVRDNQDIGGCPSPDGYHGTTALRMRRMEPDREKLSDRETLEFHIEIDHYYPG